MKRGLAVVRNDFAEEEETKPGRLPWKVRFDGVEVAVPMYNDEGRITMRWLLQQFREDGGREFELRDPSGRLVASSGQVSRYLTQENMSTYLDDPCLKK